MKEELTKGDVYVVVDTPKKAKKLKNLLDMFGEPMFTIPNNDRSSHNGRDYGWGYGFSNGQWQGFNTKSIAHNGKKFKKVSIKELQHILAKEYLRNLYTERLEPKIFDKFAELKEAERNGKNIECRLRYSGCTWVEKTHKGFFHKFEYRIKPEDPVKVGDWMFNPNSKKITQVKKENHGKSLIGSGWVKIKDTELVEKLNSL